MRYTSHSWEYLWGCGSSLVVKIGIAPYRSLAVNVKKKRDFFLRFWVGELSVVRKTFQPRNAASTVESVVFRLPTRYDWSKLPGWCVTSPHDLLVHEHGAWMSSNTAIC